MTSDQESFVVGGWNWKILRLFDGGRDTVPSAWKLFQRIPDASDYPKWRLVAEGPGETADLIEALIPKHDP